MVILERVTRATAKAAREAACARQAAGNNTSKSTSHASNEQSKPANKGTSSKRKRSDPSSEEPSKAAKKSKAGGAGRSNDVDQWLWEIIGAPQESRKIGGSAKEDKRKTTKGNPKGKERQRSGSAGAVSSKVSKRGESPAKGQSKPNKAWPWDIEERSQEGSAKVVQPKQKLPSAVEEEFPDDSEPDSGGGDGGDGEANLLDDRLVMKWIDDNHVVNEGAEMRSTAPTPKELMGTWRWLWRTNHGKIYRNANCGGIAFRMHGSGSFSHHGIRGRMRYDPNRVSTDACKWAFTGGMEARGAVRLQFTVQPGPLNRDGKAWSHPHLLCVRFVDPDESEVELFALAQNRMNKRDGPRGFLPGTARVPTFGNEMEHKTLMWEFGISARRGYPLWRQWLGWKGEQRGWYRETKGWSFEM